MQNRIVIFDLDGTIYQNSVFHRGYLRTLVAGTWAEPLEADLVRLTEAISRTAWSISAGPPMPTRARWRRAPS